MTTQELMLKNTKDEILSLLQEINRPGIDNVIQYLQKSTFFTERCNSHHKFRGGLAVHSLGVYNEFEKLNTGLPEDSIRIVSLLHDICKSHHPSYNHIGKGHHGYRSLLLLNALNLKLNTGEDYAIEMHMHRINNTPKESQYVVRDSIRHYLHQSDHRDAGTFPNSFSSYTPEEKRNLSYKIDTLLYSTHRPGIEIVIDHLHRNRGAFYTVPASIKYHNNTYGGLAKHSMDVFHEAKAMFESLIEKGEKLSFGMDSIILCSLLHDVCKMDEYEMKDGRPRHTSQYHKYNPHGMKSIRLLRRWHLKMSDEECQAIIWHMGLHAKDAMAQYSTSYDAVATGSELVRIIHEADGRAARFQS